MKPSNFLFIAYFFADSDGVGAFRSKALYHFLIKNGLSPFCISKHSFGKKAKNSIFFWMICICWTILRGNYRQVYFSCGPFTPLLPICISCWLKRCDLIVDFRDPWSLNIRSWRLSYRPLVWRIKLWLSELIEVVAYKICKYFIVCTPGMFTEYANLFKNDSKLKLITNGYSFSHDELETFKENSFLKKKGGIQIVCLGKFADYGDEPSALKALKVIHRYIKNHGENSVHIHFVGSKEDLNRKFINALGLQSQCTFYPKLPYKQALKLAAGADMGLCLVRNERYDFSTKIFDYIGLGLPIMDCFDHSSNFFHFFSKFICNIENFDLFKKNNIIEIRNEFSREIIFKQFLYLLRE